MRLLRLAPWRRAPVLLARRAGVALAVLAAVLVASLPAAAAGPFLSAGRSATLHRQVEQACGWQVGARITTRLYFEDPFATGGVPRPGFDGAATAQRRYAVADGLAARVPGLGPAAKTLIADGYGNGVPIPLYLMARTDLLAHVHPLQGPSGEGVWITDEYAVAMGLSVGDTVVVGRDTDTAGASPVRVAAIYRSVRQFPDEPYWCTLISYYRPPDGNRPSPQIMLLDQATLLRVGTAQRMSAVQFLEYPLADDALSIDAARTTAAGIATMRAAITAGGPWTFGQDVLSGTRLTSHLADFAARADLAHAAMRPGVLPITVGGTLVGLVVVAAAAVFWVRRRRVELVVLAVRGVGTAGLAVKAVLEVLPVVVAGAAIGWGGAWALVRWVGPDPVLSREAGPWAVAGAVGALAASVALIAVVAALACRGLVDAAPRGPRPLLRRVPWELGLFPAAALLWQWLGGSRELTDVPGGVGAVARVPGRLLVVPFLLVLGTCLVAARVGVRYLRRPVRHRVRRRRPVAVLVRRRIARHAVMTAVLAAATLVPIALAVYGATVTGSVRRTAGDEARLILGTDVILTLTGPAAVPPSLAGAATEVLRIDGAMIYGATVGGATVDGVRVGGVQADLLVVDPRAFARVAYWDDRLGGPLPAILAPLDAATIAAADPVAAGPARVTWRGEEILGGPLQVVTTSVLPAQQGGYPVAVVDRSVVGGDIRYAERQLWVRGDPVRIRSAVLAAGLPVSRIRSADRFYLNTLWEPLTFTFGYLSALSLLTAVVTLVGMLLYLESRLPAYRRGYQVLRRMGLSDARHRRALLTELGVPLGVGLFGALVVTAALVAGFHRDFEINNAAPPGVVLDLPYRGTAALCVAVAMVAVAVAGYTHHRIARGEPGEALRDVA